MNRNGGDARHDTVQQGEGQAQGSDAGSPAPATEPSETRKTRRRDFQGVIVTLDVEWRPEGELSDSELREQRARIEAAQDRIVEDLGSHGRLGRRLTATAQMAVDVDAQGRRLLEQHELVAAVDDETLDRPSSSTE